MTVNRPIDTDLPPQVSLGNHEPAEAAEGDLWIAYWYDPSYMVTRNVVRRWQAPLGGEPHWATLRVLEES